MIRRRSEAGYSLIELMVSLTLTSTMLGAILSTYAITTRRAYDEAIVSRTNEQSRLALDLIGYDLRMTGAGMPLGQGGFAPGGAGLGDAPLPILTTATATNIVLRLNENGRVAVLTASFTPSAGARTFQVYSAANFTVGDTIYISNASAGGSLGLKGTITTINGTSITIAAGYITSAGAIFDTGSVVHRVTEVTYDSPADGAGITRNNGSGLIRVVPTSSFLLAYYDSTGAVLTPPLSAATIQNQLCAIGVTTSVISSSKMKNGTNYTSTAQDRIALRNLILSR